MTGRPVALVTGASAGIGRAIADELAARRYDLVVVARSRERLEALATELRATCGVDVEVLPADLLDPEQRATVEVRCSDRARPVDVLVNNAGIGTVGLFAELPADDEERAIELNVVALVRLTRAALGAMVERGSGRILQVSSIAGNQPTPNMATYGATKAFVTSFTLAVREELVGTGVTITALCPGFTRTEFQERAGVDQSDVPGFLWSKPEDVAKAGVSAMLAGQAVCTPGLLNRIAATVSGFTPHAVSRRVASLALRRARH